MKKLVMLLALSGLVLSCAKKKEIRRNFIVSPDLSGSRDSASKVWYREVIEQSILPYVGQKDRIVITPTDYGSETSAQEILYKDFSHNNYTNKLAGLKEGKIKQRVHRDSVQAAVKEFRNQYNAAVANRSALRSGTDIIGTLKTAKEYKQPEMVNVLVLLSDMLISKVGDNAESRLVTKDGTAALLKDIEKVDLSGFKVIVITGSQPNIAPEKYDAIKEFWSQYFKLCKADLVEYSSGSVSKLENLLRQEK